MKISKKITLLSILMLFIISSFTKKGRYIFATLKCTEDTITQYQLRKDSIRLYMVDFNLTINNGSLKGLNVHDSYLRAGHKNELSCDYYLKIYKEINGKKNPLEFKHIAHIQAEYPGELIILPPRKGKTYPGTSSLYPITEPGKYYIKAVFVNDYQYLGESNLDSVIVF